GAQIIQRNTNTIFKINKTKISKLKELGLDSIRYKNTKHNTDLLRIQSKNGLMAGHEKMNDLGKKISKIIKS
ncbi:MAG: hypothetical protein ABH832_03645, partial [bacterium]